ncbi:MAG: ABC transporter ATP-binding protein [Leptolyngbyaceae bacterium]|nr:ABC transporter ATP-binding protein [Leptolyngbyaceae bacterium]
MTTKLFSILHALKTHQSAYPAAPTVISPNPPTSELGSDPDSVLTLAAVSRTFPGIATPAVNQVSFSLQPGELLGLLGPSGCGKTTLLRLIAGFDRPQAGQIILDGIEVTGNGAWIPPERRGIGMVFQDYALFPHLTVAKNVAFGLGHHRKGVFGREPLSVKARRERVSEVLDLVGLSGMAHRYPHQISGGQQQRVALARALAPNPPMVLLDEPLSNLDATVRLQLRQELRNILKSVGATGIFVTHDQEEALSVCDRVAVMANGCLEQIGTPQELYCQPASRFIAEFIVQANFLPAHSKGGSWMTELGQISNGIGQTAEEETAAAEPAPMSASDPAIDLMIRQENASITLDTTSNIVVRDRQFLGRENRYCLQLPSGQTFHARVPAECCYDIGTPVKVAIAPQAIQLFPHIPHRPKR